MGSACLEPYNCAPPNGPAGLVVTLARMPVMVKTVTVQIAAMVIMVLKIVAVEEETLT